MMDHHSRISKKRLEELNETIGQRDREILQSLQKCRYLTTIQMKRLHFNNASTRAAALRATSRGLSKLKTLGLIVTLRRRIGGAAKGSSQYVWALSPNGFKLLNLADIDSEGRKRFFEPSQYFLCHTLTVAETYIQLIELCQKNNLNLVKSELEPACWRNYQEAGKPTILKPDLYAVTAGEYKDSWFFEIDLATESYHAVIEKCDRYIHYRKSGAEQKSGNVFPFIVWIVPDEKRRRVIQKLINEEFTHGPDLFMSILPDELEPLLLLGARQFLEKQSQKGAPSHDE
jgi:hypothetical protein